MPLTNSLIYKRLESTNFTRSAVANLSVTVVGCGALGSEAARLLGLLGVGSVLLIDHDLVESTNFTHSPYLRSTPAPTQSADTLGRPKSEVLAENLATYFPHTHWQSLPCEIADAGFARLQPSALLFSCTDNALARVETAYAAHRLQLPMMDAGLKGHAFWSGRVAWLPGGPAACYLCQLGEVRRAELLSLSLAASESCSTDRGNDPILPSTPTMASIIAGLQIDLGLRLALTAAEHPPQARAWELSLPLPDTAWHSFDIPRSADCPWHGTNDALTLIPLPMNVPLNESLMQHKISGSHPPVLQLDWPLCVKARCATCQHLWSPMLRLATLRRRATCPACGASRLDSIDSLSQVAQGDALASLTPHQLNLPPDHLFTLTPSSK